MFLPYIFHLSHLFLFSLHLNPESDLLFYLMPKNLNTLSLVRKFSNDLFVIML